MAGWPPKKNAAFVFYIGLVSQADTKLLQANPTLAAGDAKVATDDAAPANLGTLPVVDADFTDRVKVSLSAGEMNGDMVTVIMSDAAGTEWADLLINIPTSTRQLDDLAYPTTSGRSLDVTAAGEVGLDLDNTSGTLAAAQFASNFLTAAKINASALDGKGDWNIDKTGYSVSSTGLDAVLSSSTYAAAVADAIWDELLAGHVTADSAGLLLNEWQDGGRLDLILDIIAADVVNIDGIVPAAAGDAMTLTAAAVDLIWDETMAGHTTADTSGLLMNEWQDGGRLDLILDIIAADTTTDIPALIAALNDIAAGDVWAVDATTQQTQGTFGQAIGDPVADTTTIYQSVATDAAGDNVAIDVIAVKAETTLIVADTNELQTDDVPGLIAALNDIAASDVLTQVNAALDTAISELGVAAPTATPTLRTGLMLLYMMVRNQTITQTSGTDALEVYNDAGTKITQKLITDDGSDYTEAKMS